MSMSWEKVGHQLDVTLMPLGATEPAESVAKDTVMERRETTTDATVGFGPVDPS